MRHLFNSALGVLRRGCVCPIPAAHPADGHQGWERGGRLCLHPSHQAGPGRELPLRHPALPAAPAASRPLPVPAWPCQLPGAPAASGDSALTSLSPLMGMGEKGWGLSHLPQGSQSRADPTLSLQVTPFPEAYRETLHAYKISEQDTDVRANVRPARSASAPCCCPCPPQQVCCPHREGNLCLVLPHVQIWPVSPWLGLKSLQ